MCRLWYKAPAIILPAAPDTFTGIKPTKFTGNFHRSGGRTGKILLPKLPRGQFSYYLKGSFSGEIEQTKRQELAQAALVAVEAKIVEEMVTPDLISLTAYTPLVKKHLFVEGERFNLNLAAFYDDYFNKTVIWAGFPLIHDPY